MDFRSSAWSAWSCSGGGAVQLARPVRDLRPSGYASRLYEVAYGFRSPLYDLIVWWGMLPLGGVAACRREFARWCRPEPGQRLASLCCGTGSSERALLERVPSLRITGIDLGAGQLATARRKTSPENVDYRLENASATTLPSAEFDRVVIILALHEMPRDLRLAVLREARRLCNPEGLVVAIEHGRPRRRASQFLQAVWWLFWLPGNPEAVTSKDLQRHGLASEMREAGMRVVDRHATRPDWVQGVIARP